MAWLEKIVLVLAAIGAINWILYTFDYGLVDLILTDGTIVAKIVYWIIGLCGLWALVKAFQ